MKYINPLPRSYRERLQEASQVRFLLVKSIPHTSDYECAVSGMHEDSLCAELHSVSTHRQPVFAAFLPAARPDQRFLIKTGLKKSAPFPQRRFRKVGDGFTPRTDRLPARPVNTHGKPVNIGKWAAEQFALNGIRSEIEQLHTIEGQQCCIAGGLSLVDWCQHLGRLGFVKDIVHNKVQSKRRAESANTQVERNLRTHIANPQRSQAGNHIILVNDFITKPAELVMGGVRASHHQQVSLVKHIVGH